MKKSSSNNDSKYCFYKELKTNNNSKQNKLKPKTQMEKNKNKLKPKKINSDGLVGDKQMVSILR